MKKIHFGLTDIWTDVRMDRQMGIWIDRWMDRWMDAQTDKHTLLKRCVEASKKFPLYLHSALILLKTKVERHGWSPFVAN